MTIAPALVISLPLATAAILVALLDRVPRRVTQWTAIVLGAMTLAGAVVLLTDVVQHGPRVDWIGGWHPGNRVGLGIALAVDLASACIAVLIATTVLAAIVFSFEYFEDVGAIFYVLILAMLGAMIAFAYAADVFDLFVWYEVFSVAAYALASYRTESESAYQGALHFALTNSVAGLFFLVGISLLEGRTGELGLVAIGHSLAAHGQSDALVATALAFIAIGLFTRGALAPLHFWFDEVHAAAPAPLCAILSGAMVPLALYGFARIYWTTFVRVLPPTGALAGVTIGIGILSAVYGTVLALRESRLKRKLAHATVAHSGVALAAIGEFTPRALGAAAAFEASYAAAAAALFCAIAILRNRTNEYDAKQSRGAGRSLPLTGAAFALGTLGLASIWPTSRAIASAGTPLASTIVIALVIVVGAGTGGAFSAVFVRVFLLPPRAVRREQQRTPPWFLLAPALGLGLLSTALAITPGTLVLATRAAAFLCDRRAYADTVQTGAHRAIPELAAATPAVVSWLAPVGALGMTLLVVGSASGLRRMRVAAARNAAVRALRATNAGDAGAYIAWIVGSAAVLATVYSLATTQ